MKFSSFFSSQYEYIPFESYNHYTSYLFACADRQFSIYIKDMMGMFALEKGGFKNVLYPDIEIAHDLCEKHLADFTMDFGKDSTDCANNETDNVSNIFEDLGDLFEEFGTSNSTPTDDKELSINELLCHIQKRASITDLENVQMPLFSICKKLEMTNFTTFCFVCAILSSTQTNYAPIFQMANQNGALSAPSIESAARIYYGGNFSITGAYGEMSLALEQLAPILDLKINGSMPFTTILSPDKRMIDFLFGKNPMRVDENYSRFFNVLTDDTQLDPFISNKGQLDALKISYEDNIQITSLWGDEGSGRKFTIKHFCADKGLGCISINCGKLFVYDFSFVDKALWAVSRECILSNSCCCLDNLGYREEEKTKFFGYMDLAFEKLTSKSIPIFTVSKEKLPMKEMTAFDFTQLELPTPNNSEREELWKYYAQEYTLNSDVDLEEMATKFLFTAGKIKSALRQSKSLAAMAHHIAIPREILFLACYNQMSHELTQKATKIKANFTWDDIVMNPDQRQSLQYACDQMRYRKKVLENWDYNKKYPYGRGLSVLLFGAPGTGKSMCAQVLANALNLELYRVDLSKVVDKYVGETEKSISMIFREAKKCNVVLFFDECDTLFAKRSDDGGSGQASSNNKTALLLQEVEAYDGVSVLATNYKHNIDPAFFRRMKFIVEFQQPDPETRYILWTTTIPKGTPLADDVDIRFLADRFEFVGGNIKNCVYNAAFLAAAENNGEKVHMKHYLQAIRYEFVKTGKVFTRSDFEPYANLLL